MSRHLGAIAESGLVLEPDESFPLTPGDVSVTHVTGPARLGDRRCYELNVEVDAWAARPGLVRITHAQVLALAKLVGALLVALFAACGDNISTPDARPDPDAQLVDAAPACTPALCIGADAGACETVCAVGPLQAWTCNANGCACEPGGTPRCFVVDGGAP